MKTALLATFVIVLLILHQDSWFWRTSDPLIIGFIPIGLFYHACFTVAASILMWMLVKFAWPSHLEHEVDRIGPTNERTSSEAEEDEFR
jgi:hypothetical protein